MTSFAEKMGNLFEQHLFTDCTIVAEDGVKFNAHKCILANQSPVFRAMFEHQMIEVKEGIVNIKDIKSPILEQMLRFIYTGTAPKLAEMAMELLEASVEYQIDILKELCEEELSKSIGNDNVCELLILADRYSIEHLKIRSINFIKKHAKEVMKSDGWKMLVEGNYPELSTQILMEENVNIKYNKSTVLEKMLQFIWRNFSSISVSSNKSLKEMTEKFVGKWKLVDSQNFDEYMKEVGVGFFKRTAAAAIKPVLSFEVNGGHWKMVSESTFTIWTCEFELGKEIEQYTADGRKMKSTFTFQDGKLIEEQKKVNIEDKDSRFERYIDSEDQLVIESLSGSVKAVHKYQKI